MDDLQQSIAITFDDFREWIDKNTPVGWDVDDSETLLAYMGYVYFQFLKQSLPALTLEQCDVAFFGQGNKEQLLALIRSENLPTIN